MAGLNDPVMAARGVGKLARLDRIERPAAVPVAARSEQAAYHGRARRLGLSFTPQADLGPNAESDLDAIHRGTFAKGRGNAAEAYVAPDEGALADVHHWLTMHPSARRRLQVTTPTAIRAALRQAGRHGYHATALARLDAVDPCFSARRTITWPQAVVALLIVVGITVALGFAPLLTILIIDLVAAGFFFGVSLLRFAAAAQVPERLPRPLQAHLDTDAPVYTVLVPLLREAHIVGQLVAGLDGLVWPRDRLDIKLIVEEDDLPTRAAAARLASGAPYEIVVVPPGGPRTKPMALQYALTFARGAYVTIYDAEDRPHPGQLSEAFETFRRSDERLACLQAPIIIENGRSGVLARLFAIEYSALFDGLLPLLAGMRLPLPLGGTSNHFRRQALEEVGGWDPYNVTEDADLGIRLARFGYRAGTITLPTLEEAPTRLGAWLRQRSRWFKGWMQTWLVHARHPVTFAREIGGWQLLGFSLVGLGMIVSAIAHPAFLATPFLIGADPLAVWSDGDLFIAALIGVNLFNLVAGYAAVGILTTRTLELRGRSGEMWMLLLLPIYWLLMAMACLRAMWQLALRPHHWEKTPHVGRRGSSPGAPGRAHPPLVASRLRI